MGQSPISEREFVVYSWISRPERSAWHTGGAQEMFAELPDARHGMKRTRKESESTEEKVGGEESLGVWPRVSDMCQGAS